MQLSIAGGGASRFGRLLGFPFKLGIKYQLNIVAH